MTTTAFTVRGMTCAHCVASVREELQRLPAVRSVDVDLASGRVVVESSEPVDDESVRAAVDEAGYEVAAESAR